MQCSFQGLILKAIASPSGAKGQLNVKLVPFPRIQTTLQNISIHRAREESRAIR